METYKRIKNEIIELFKMTIEAIIKDKMIILLLWGIYSLSYLKLFIVNINYHDDVYRVWGGYHGWLDFSRWITESLVNFVHAGWYLADVSPISQLLACLFIALASYILIKVFRKENGANVAVMIIASTLLALTPYFLNCIPLKYDSPYIALSILAGIVPFFFYKKKVNWITYSIISFIFVLVICTTYQASTGLYPLMVIFIVSDRINNGEDKKDIFKFTWISAASYLSALLVFRYLLMLPNMYYTDPPKQGIIEGAFMGYLTRIISVYYDFKKSWLILIGIIILSFICVYVVNSKISKIISAIIAILTVIVGSFFCFGAYLFINIEVADRYAPRTMMGIGFIIAIMAVYISSHKQNYIPKIAVISLFWCFFVFSSTFANALAEQQKYADLRMYLVLDDINELEIANNDEKKIFQVKGGFKSPVVQNMSKDYELLGRIMEYFFAGGFFGEYRIYNYYGLTNMERTDDINLSEMNLPILKDTMYHTIRGNDKYILVELK